jgi:hypothetical protein
LIRELEGALIATLFPFLPPFMGVEFIKKNFESHSRAEAGRTAVKILGSGCRHRLNRHNNRREAAVKMMSPKLKNSQAEGWMMVATANCSRSMECGAEKL